VPLVVPSCVRRALLLPVIAFALIAPALPAAADHEVAPTTVFIPETGHTADLLFLDAWRSEPRLIGYPITEEFPARAGFTASPADGQIVQFYQNVALHWSPDAPLDSQIRPLPLGERALDLLYTRNPGLKHLPIIGRTACPADSGTACRGFVESGQTVRGDFLAYWEQNDGAFWLGAPITEAFRAPDRSAVQYFEFGALRKNQRGIVAPLPIGSMMARELGLDTAPISQPEGVPEFDPALFLAPSAAPVLAPAPAPESTPEPSPTPAAAPAPPADWVAPKVKVGWITGTRGPGPQVGAYKEIVVSISQQAMWAYEGGELMASSYVSTGTADLPETVTPIGQHIVLTKYEKQTMEGVIGGEAYKVPDVPHILYFDDLGNALHGAYWHSEFGAPRSHGCVNLPLDIAAWVYEWSPIGTPVTVVP
jgi:lipoprotein-anchoring transpeptidase ErfK/SrfK